MMQKGEAPTKRRRKETTWCQTPLAIILGICWRFLSIGADLTLVIASGPSPRTNSTHPNSFLGDGAFSGSSHNRLHIVPRPAGPYNSFFFYMVGAPFDGSGQVGPMIDYN